MATACTATPVTTPAPSTATATLAIITPSPTPTATRPSTLALVCGTISDFVSDSSQTNGSFVLNSPGRAPLRITIPAGRLAGGRADGYGCIGVLAGVPYPLFDVFVPGGATGLFINSGTFPASSASPPPTGFVIPQSCAYVVPPVVGADQTDWKIDCGAGNNDARGVLGTALTQQGWTSCGSGLASAQWRKNNVMLAVAESSLVPGDYPRLTQFARVISPCV